VLPGSWAGDGDSDLSSTLLRGASVLDRFLVSSMSLYRIVGGIEVSGNCMMALTMRSQIIARHHPWNPINRLPSRWACCR